MLSSLVWRCHIHQITGMGIIMGHGSGVTIHCKIKNQKSFLDKLCSDRL